MTSWLARALGRPATTPKPRADLYCSFCGRNQLEVHKLIAGQGVYICDYCIGLCVNLCDEEAPADFFYFAELVLGRLAVLPPHTPHGYVTPRLRAVIQLAAGAPVLLRRLVATANRFDDHATALMALEAISAADRTLEDRLNTVALLSDSGRLSEAISMLDAINENDLTGNDRIVYKLNYALTKLERGDCTRVQLAVHRKTAIDVDTIALPAGALGDAMRTKQLAVLTLALLGLGELDEAELVTRERIAQQPGNASAIELLARVLDVRGDRAAAAAERTKALELAHPDGVLARRLRIAVRTTGPFR